MAQRIANLLNATKLRSERRFLGVLDIDTNKAIHVFALMELTSIFNLLSTQPKHIQ